MQHAFRLANALKSSNLFNKISLLTWFLLKPTNLLSLISLFKKRVKPIDKSINLYIFPIFELLMIFHEKLYFALFPKRKNSNYNNPLYIWSIVFGYFLLPYLYFRRKNSILILYDACAWPLSYYAKKWHIPVILDFPSISHEEAIKLGIAETKLGITVKEKERLNIDFAIFCSEFAKTTYLNKTSAIHNYTAHVGAEILNQTPININHQNEILEISFIANMELRKGLDFLLESLNFLSIPFKLHLIGKISKDWVSKRINPELIKDGKICFAGPFNQEKLIEYLKNSNIQLNILPSRFDSFGMVVPETMRLGIPNIVSPFVGAGEKIIHNQSGYIMKDLSSHEISKYIYKYYNLNLDEKIRLSKQAFEHSKLISWEQYNKCIKLIFNDILSKLKPKVAFIVTHPTQFEVPFYQYVKQNEKKIDFEVIYINAQNEFHYDKEIERHIDWGFNLYEGYSFKVLNKKNLRKQFKEQLSKTKYDLIITNGYNGAYLNILDILLFNSTPLALRIDSISSNQPFAWKWWKRPILAILFSQFNYFFTVGSLSRKYVKSLGIEESKINYFSYSIDENKFKAVEDKTYIERLKEKYNLHHQKIFLCVSKLVKREIPIDIIEAFIKANNSKWTLIIIGDGSSKETLINYCKKFIHINIIFLGYIPYQELQYYYHLADTFIHSVSEENWGVSVHEAIAANCAVIASDTVGSAHDLIAHEKNGFIYPFKNISMLLKYMNLSLELDSNTKEKINQSKLEEWGYSKMWSEIKKVL